MVIAFFVISILTFALVLFLIATAVLNLRDARERFDGIDSALSLNETKIACAETDIRLLQAKFRGRHEQVYVLLADDRVEAVYANQAVAEAAAAAHEYGRVQQVRFVALQPQPQP